MSKAFKFFLVITVIIVLSTFLTPLVYGILPCFRFEKIFNRLVMIFTVTAAVLFIFFRESRKKGTFFEPESWRTYGFDFSRPWRRMFAYGFVGGALTVLLIVILEVALGPPYVRHPLMLQDVIERFFKGLVSGMTVGIAEEFFFRGFIFVNVERKVGTWLAVCVTSVFYSLTHFFNNGQIFIPAHPSVNDAFRLLLGYAEPIARHPLEILPQFIGLFLFGALLNLAFIRTRFLFLPIGIHAGAVFIIKWQYSFVREGPEVYHRFFGAPSYYDGVFEWLVLALFGYVIWRSTAGGRSRADETVTAPRATR